MALWILTRTEDGPVWDCANGFVVRAKTMSEARNVAASNCGDEGVEVWTDVAKSSCIVLASDGAASMLLRDFTAG